MSLLGYIGPETALPFLSVVAAVFGAIMILGKTATRFVWHKFLGLFGIRRNQPAVETTENEATDK